MLLLLLAALLIMVLITGLSIGAMTIPPGRILAALVQPLGIDLPWTAEAQEAAVLLQIRAPRVFLGAIAGAALALGGVLMQALFRNPLADPTLIGVSAGAALAAAACTVFAPAIALIIPLSPVWLVPIAAFAGGWFTVMLVLQLAGGYGRMRVEQVLLAGIALNALAGAGIGLLMLIANDAQMRDVAFWSFGNLGRADWHVGIMVILLSLPLFLFGLRFAPWLNALLLGEGEAAMLGIPVERLKRAAILLTCLAIGGTVAFTGLIGFVGLVVPHIIRLITGPDHRTLVPASALLGSIVLPLADVISRTAVAPVELPIGLITALIGAPFFLVLLLGRRNREAI